MKPSHLLRETGVTLAVTLFMLVLLTAIGVSAMLLSTTHSRLVSNQQASYELETAVRLGIEQYAYSLRSTTLLDGQTATQTVTLPNGHSIAVAITLRCLGASKHVPRQGSLSNPQKLFDTHWDVQGLAVDQSTGASITAHRGLMDIQGGKCPI